MTKWILTSSTRPESKDLEYKNQEATVNSLDTIHVFPAYRSNKNKPKKICLALHIKCDDNLQLSSNNEKNAENFTRGLFKRILHKKTEHGFNKYGHQEITFKQDELDLFDATLNYINLKYESIDKDTLQTIKDHARKIFGLSPNREDAALNEIKERTSVLAAQTILISFGNKSAIHSYQEALEKLVNRINELEKNRFDENFLYVIAANIMIEEYQQLQSAVDILEAFEKINKLTPKEYALLSTLSLRLIKDNQSLSELDKSNRLINTIHYSLRGLSIIGTVTDNHYIQQAENNILLIIQCLLENEEASQKAFISLSPYLEVFKNKIDNTHPYNNKEYFENKVKEHAEKHLPYLSPQMTANLIFDLIQTKKEILKLQNKNSKISIVDNSATLFNIKDGRITNKTDKQEQSNLMCNQYT